MSGCSDGKSQPLGCAVLTANAVVWGNAVYGPLLAGMAEHGWHVHFLTDPGPVSSDEMPPGVSLEPVALSRSISPIQDLKVLRAWRRRIREIRPQMVIGNSPKGAMLGLLAAYAAQIPVRVYWIRGSKWDGRADKLGRFLRLMDRLTCAASTDRLAVSRSLARTYQEAGISNDIEVLGRGGSRGVDTQEYSPAKPRRSLDPESPRLIYVGRLAHSKGVDYLPIILEAVRSEIPGATLSIVGPIDDEDPARPETMDYLSKTQGVALMGPVKDVASVLREHDIFVFPTYREGLPNALLEAQACGLPAVGWNVTGVQDVVEDGITGRLYPVGQPRELASGIVALARDPALHEQFSLAAAYATRRDFAADVVQGRIFEWFESLPERRA